MTFGNRKVRLNVFFNTSNSLASDDCFMADIIDGCHPHPNEEDITETCVLCDKKELEHDAILDKLEKEEEVMTARDGKPTWTP
jgi:hypothetical protein